jgi:hypothetical protein
LRDEVGGALTEAFGHIDGRPNDLGGISGDYLPLAVNRAPLSLALIADDPRTFLSAAELLASLTVPSIGVATRFTGDSTWHTRQDLTSAAVRRVCPGRSNTSRGQALVTGTA